MVVFILLSYLITNNTHSQCYSELQITVHVKISILHLFRSQKQIHLLKKYINRSTIPKFIICYSKHMLRSMLYTHDKEYNLCANFFLYLVRYDFRKRVADVLEVQVSRVSILPGALSTMAGGKCQQVTFLVSGKIKLTLII